MINFRVIVYFDSVDDALACISAMSSDHPGYMFLGRVTNAGARSETGRC